MQPVRMGLLLVAIVSCASRARVAEERCGSLGAADLATDVLHYDVNLRIGESAADGIAKITMRALSAGQVIALDARDLRVESVHDGAVCFEQDAREVRVRLARPAAAGDERVVSVRYRAPPSGGLKLSSNHAFTVFHTDSWLPCRFDPADKATFTLKLDVPNGWTAVTTAPDRPHSAYVLGFVAAKLEEHRETVGGVELRFLGPRSPEQLTEVFAATAPALRFFVDRSGLPFPGTRYTQALVPIGTGQELAGLSLLPERYADDVLRDAHEDWLVVHELSHQWWGNLVTCASWRDFWMHEAFATFMTAAFKEIRWGRAAYDREVSLATKRYARLRSENRDRALAPSGTPSAEEVGGPLPYAKGMLVLHRLRSELGDAHFFGAVRRFTQEHAGASATTEMLRHAFERESGADLKPLFDDFVFGTKALPD
jgi:aminopeptidase N